MDPSLQRETNALRRSWDRHEGEFLRDYLVAGVEDPRINVQSILSRHFLLQGVVGERYRMVRQAELEFATALNWLLGLQEELAEAEGRAAIRFGLERDVENVEGIVIPSFVRRLWQRLDAGSRPASERDESVIAPALDDHPNYLRAVLDEPTGRLLESRVADTFVRIWDGLLGQESLPTPLLAVLEVACGSANDYRALAAGGLSRLVDYTGFDLCAKNIANARQRFPQARFLEGNALAIAAPDRSFDRFLAHDLFEHLSLDALAVAVAECCRVTRDEACLGFFSVAEVPEHIVRPTDEYHWNTLSASRLLGLFAAQGFAANVIHIGTFLRSQFGDASTHNPNAYTFVLRRGEA